MKTPIRISLILVAVLFSAFLCSNVIARRAVPGPQGTHSKAIEQARLVLNAPEGNFAAALQKLCQALARINKTNDIEREIDTALSAHPENLDLRLMAVTQLRRLAKNGYKKGAVVSRGWSNGGGDYIDFRERDRAKNISTLITGLNYLKKAPPSSAAYLYDALARELLTERGGSFAWKLTALTDYENTQEPQEGYASRISSGVPVDQKGAVLVYKIPTSWKAASTDGERWRWSVEQMAQSSSEHKIQAHFAIAQFYFMQLRVNGAIPRHFLHDESKDLGDFDLRTLKDTESIVKLATGVQKITLEGESNYIKTFKKIAKQHTFATYKIQAAQKLAAVYQAREQLVAAAQWYEVAGKTKRVEQLRGKWGSLETITPFAAGVKPLLPFRFRNATSVSLKVQKIDMPRLTDDIKKYLRSNPTRLNGQKTSLSNLGYGLLRENASYLSAATHEWKKSINPLKGHRDKRIEIEFPHAQAGAYFVTAKVQGGNTCSIVVFVNSALIVRKTLKNKELVYVADARTGKALAHTTLHFFGYSNEYIKKQADRITSGRNYSIHTAHKTATTDERGIIELTEKELPTAYQWLLHIDDTSKESFAYLGFGRIYFHSGNDNTLSHTRSFVQTDRPVYRPGDTVKLAGWLQYLTFSDEHRNLFENTKVSLVLRNARNEKVFTTSLKTTENAGVHTTFTLPKDAVLGSYALFLNGIASPKGFRVEEYKKPEYEVVINAPLTTPLLGEDITWGISARYYFGEPVRNGEVSYTITRTPITQTWFEPAPWDWLYGQGYWWQGGDISWYPRWQKWGCIRPLWQIHTAQPEVVLEGSGSLNKEGGFNVSIDTSLVKVLYGDTDHRYNIRAEVKDSSRRIIAGTSSLVVSPDPYKVQIWTKKGFYKPMEKIDWESRVRSASGKDISAQAEVRLYQLHDAVKNTEKSIVEKLVSTQNYSTNDGRINGSFKGLTAGTYKVELRAKSKGFKRSGGFVFKVVGDSTTPLLLEGFDIVSESSVYAPGDKATFSLQGVADETVIVFERPLNGRYDTYSIPEGKTFSLDITTKDMPLIFVEALRVKNGKVDVVVRRLLVPPEDKKGTVTIVPKKKKLKPGDEVELEVSFTDADKKPLQGELIVAVWDKALDYIASKEEMSLMTHFWKFNRHHYARTTSNDAVHFYMAVADNNQRMHLFAPAVVVGSSSAGALHEVKKAKGSRGIQTTGLMSLSEASLSDKVAAQAPMKDASQTMAKVQLRDDFKDSPFWSSLVHLDETGKTTIRFKAPDNLTTWSLSAWAMAKGGKVAQIKNEVIVKKDILIRPQAPRFFVEGDEVVLSAVAHNYTQESIKAEVSISFSNKVLVLRDSPVQHREIPAGGEVVLTWKVDVVNAGKVTIKTLLKTPKLSDGVSYSYNAKPFSAPLFKREVGSMVEGSLKNIALNVPDASEDATLELTWTPSLAAVAIDALPYLIEYPYGCTEQTVHRFIPAVIVRSTLKKMGLKLSDIQLKKRGAQKSSRQAILDEKHLNDVITMSLKRLKNMQLSDGGWGWFSGSAERSSVHTTAVVLRALLRGREEGLEVPPSMINPGVAYLERYRQKRLLDLNDKKTSLTHNDILLEYILSWVDRSSAPMRTLLYENRTSFSLYGQILMGHIYNAVGDDLRLQQMRADIDQYLEKDERLQYGWLRISEQSYWWSWYGDEYETLASYLSLLTKVDAKGWKARYIAAYLAGNRKVTSQWSSYWNSTRDTAVIVDALSQYMIASGEKQNGAQLTLSIDGKKVKDITLTPADVLRSGSLSLPVTTGDHVVELAYTGEGRLYYASNLSYTSNEKEMAAAGLELEVTRSYYRLERVPTKTTAPSQRGQSLSYKTEGYKRVLLQEGELVTSGTLLEVELRIKSANEYEYLLLEDFKPAGWEVLETKSGWYSGGLHAYRELRSDRLSFFIQNLNRGTHVMHYKIRAETPGVFGALPTQIGAMYAPRLRGNSASARVGVQE